LEKQKMFRTFVKNKQELNINSYNYFTI